MGTIPRRPGRRLLAATVPMLLLAPAGVAAAVGPGVRMAPMTSAPAACPAPYPLSQVRRGLQATGWTTSHGRSPQHFAVRVLGVLRSAIAPGVDLILIKTDSPAIRAAGGTWEGMSGSPIYTADGRLLGALSYGLSRGPSRTAGVTPAAAMYRLFSMPRGSHARSAASRIALRPDLRSAVVRARAGTATQAAAGLHPLTIPVTVSGLPSGRMATVARFLHRSGATWFSLHSGNSVGTNAVAGPASTQPGAPFAVALATGDVTIAAIGTVTAVCGHRLIGFGHPFTFAGPSGASAQRATVLYVQRDSLGAPYVQANVGRRIGIIDQDRMVGVEGRLGATHPATVIVSKVSASTGLHRHARSQTTITNQVASTAANALYGDLLATLQKEGSGSVDLTYTLRGHRADGLPWGFRRSDHISDRFDAEFAAANSLFGTIDAIVSNRFAKVAIDKVTIVARGHDRLNERTLAGLRVFRGGAWHPVHDDTVLAVHPGSVIRLQAKLTAYQHTAASRLVRLDVIVPSDASPGPGAVQVSGGEDLANMIDPTAGATSFPSLLAALRAAPANASIGGVVTASDAGGNPLTATRTVRLPNAIAGTIMFGLNVS